MGPVMDSKLAIRSTDMGFENVYVTLILKSDGDDARL